MQKINIKENEFSIDDFSDIDDKYCNFNILEKSQLNLKGKELEFSNDVSNKRNSNKQLIKEFIEWYIDKKGINFCPYCGKNYIAYFCNDLKYKNITECENITKGFDIEHFFPKNFKDSNNKKPYAQLAKNLYNWHLACIICNQRLKGDRNPLWGTNKNLKVFNPYFGWIYEDGEEIKVESDDFDSKVTFYGNSKNDKEKREQIFNTQHSKFFKLGEIYLNSQDTFNIFNFIQDKRIKMKNELNNFKIDTKNLNEKEKEYKIKKYKDYFFKNYYPENEQEILKFSNGKLKKDLIENLKI